MKLKSLIVAALMLAVAGAAMAKTPAHTKHGNKKVHKAHVAKKHHKVSHKKTAAM